MSVVSQACVGALSGPTLNLAHTQRETSGWVWCWLGWFHNTHLKAEQSRGARSQVGYGKTAISLALILADRVARAAAPTAAPALAPALATGPRIAVPGTLVLPRPHPGGGETRKSDRRVPPVSVPIQCGVM